MKSMVEIPGSLFEQCRVAAELRGEPVEEFVAAALHAYLRPESGGEAVGWRTVFGKARPEEVESVDTIVREEFGRIDPDAWK